MIDRSIRISRTEQKKIKFFFNELNNQIDQFRWSKKVLLKYNKQMKHSGISRLIEKLMNNLIRIKARNPPFNTSHFVINL